MSEQSRAGSTPANGSSLRRFLPFLGWLPEVTRNSLRADGLAGLTGAAIVLPQGVAFATIAGLPPEYGLYTAMITPVVAALFGSSMFLVSGPTTAISALIFAALSQDHIPGSADYIAAALCLTLVVGLIQLAFGLARLGRFVGFVSHPVMIGFSSGAAILIALSQLGPALGVALPRPEAMAEFLPALMQSLPLASPACVMLALVAITVAVLVRWIDGRLPNYLLALIAGGALNLTMGDEVRLVGTLPQLLPALNLSSLNPARMLELAEPALAIAIIGLLESVSIARALAVRAGQDHDSNQEIIGQGLSNLAGGLFSSYVGSGSFTRSALNRDAGAVTPLAAVFASVALVGLLLLVAPLFAHLPVPVIAGVILLVAWRLIDLRGFLHIWRQSRSDGAVAVITFAATLLVGLEFAVFAGVIVSLAVFLNGSMNAQLEWTAPNPAKPNHSFSSVETGVPECPQVAFGRMNGPLYFGSVDAVRAALRRLEAERPGQKHLVLKLTGIGQLDSAGAELLQDEARRRAARGGRIYLTSRFRPLYARLQQYGLVATLGDENIYGHRHDAIADIVPRLDPAICATCKTRIFRECAGRPGGTE